jgi:hypothetical protein
MADKKRASGYYWVKHGGCWEVVFWDNDKKVFFMDGREYKTFEEIDERQIVRETPIKENKISNDEKCLNNFLLDGCVRVKDLTKPMGYDMNPLQRNYMDSTH